MSQNNFISIIIADDHELIRHGIRRVLSCEQDMRVVGEASNAAELMDILKKVQCSVLILDISMPGRNGIEVLKDIHTRYPHIKVLVLSIYPEEQYALRALKLGASGYLTKEVTAETLVFAIRKIANGKKFITESIAESLAEYLTEGDEKNPHQKLSDREFEIIKMLASGKSVSEIAHELFINAKTVSTYRRRILAKLHLKNNAEIVRYCLEHHLID
ncbi:MAG: response regulator transcription factor [Spirochaetes bacterium]|nr:response regulator transcription factor [Spirochaetota bacterium]